ncbi:MAG TPA: DUF262 domain-containing protein [Cyanothece sp. UBA12306]|nr:DUF262 domain-containing protein [Cyanothece sp. UBA12306]
MNTSTINSQEVNIKLFEGEIVDFDHKKDSKNQESQDLTDDEINQKYIEGDIRIVTEQARYPLSSVVSMINTNKYQLNPDFQRRRRWNNVRKSRLIESFIMNVPIPPIFLYEISFAEFEVMDGQQRMSTIYDFYENKFALEGLQEWKELNGKTYDSLPDQVRAGIDRRYISSIILLKETGKTEEQAKKLKKLVFERLNSGGIKLEAQETRNALYDGPFNQLCIELSGNETFRKLWNITIKDDDVLSSLENGNLLQYEECQEDEYEEKETSEIYKKMDDVEFVLRFFAYRHINKIESRPLNNILDDFLIQGNEFQELVLDQYKNLFEETIYLISEILEEKAFWLWRKGRKGSRRQNDWVWSNKPMKFVYDPIMQAFSQYTDQSEKLISKKQDIQKEIKQFYEKNSDLFEGRKTTINHVAERIKLTIEFLEQFS